MDCPCNNCNKESKCQIEGCYYPDEWKRYEIWITEVKNLGGKSRDLR